MSTAPEQTGAPDVSRRRLPGIGVRAGSFADRVWRRWSDAGPFVVPDRADWPLGLRRARIAGLVLLGVQLVALCWWSSVLANRFALTKDFSVSEQAIYLLAHGHLNPYTSTLGYSFWQNHAEFILWPLTPLQLLWPHPVTLMWIQALATVGAEAIAFGWICDIAARRAWRSASTTTAIALIALGVVLLVANPWILWASSFDFHFEALATVFVVGAARDLARDRRRVWLWALLGLACGDVGASYIAAAGLSGIIAGRRWSRRGAFLVVMGLGLLIVLGAFHGTKGSGAHEFGALIASSNGTIPKSISALTVVKAALHHPSRVINALWANHVNIWANLSPSGVIGLIYLPVLVPVLLVLVEGELPSATVFSDPGFQNLAILPLVAVGTVAVCAWLAGRTGHRMRWLFPAVVGFVAANTIAWAVVWVPQASTQWLTISPGAASVLKHLKEQISPNDEVVVQQGVEGAFSDRAKLYSVFHSNISAPISAHKIWIIFSPGEGIETAPTANIYADITTLAANPAMHLVAASDGIWAFEYTAPPNTKRLMISAKHPWETGAWTATGAAGVAVMQGPPSTWHVASTTRPGYIIDRAYWRELPGSYRVGVSLAVSSTANVEIWNATTSTLLKRFSVPGTNGPTKITTDVNLTRTVPEHMFSGRGPWRMQVQEPIGDQIEVRIWSPGGNDQVSVYRVGLRKLR